MPNGSPGDGEGIFDEGFELRSIFGLDFHDHTKSSMATYPDIKVAKSGGGILGNIPALLKSSAAFPASEIGGDII
jgi:hypothetical protein